MSYNPREIGSFSSLVQGQTSTIRIPTDWAYFELIIEFEGSGADFDAADPASVFDRFELRVDTESKMAASFDSFELWKEQVGIMQPSGTCKIPLALPFMDKWGERRVTGYGTGDVNTLELQVVLKSGVDVTLSKMELFAIRGPQDLLGEHLTMRQSPTRGGDAGNVGLTNIFRSNTSVIQVSLPTAACSEVEVKQGDFTHYKASRNIAEAAHLNVGRTHTANGTLIDFVGDDILLDTLTIPDATEDIKVNTILTATAAFPVLVVASERRRG